MRTTPQNIEKFAEFADSGRVVVFDTETTGGSCSDELCQLAAAEYVNGRLERTMNIRQSKRLPKQISLSGVCAGGVDNLGEGGE